MSVETEVQQMFDRLRRNRDALEKRAGNAIDTAIAAVKIPPLHDFLAGLRQKQTGQTHAVIHDSVKRKMVKAELLALAAKFGPGDMMQFRLNPNDPTLAFVALIIEEIRRENARYSVIKWKGGNALCRTADVGILEAGDPNLVEANRASGYIEMGG